MAKVLVLEASYETVRTAVDEVFATFPLDVAGRTVLLKPNMVGMYEPDTHANTHPAVITALVERLREDGAVVTVGDNPGTSGYGAVEKSAVVSGIKEASLGSYENIAKSSRRVRLTGREEEVNVSSKVLDADVLVSVPKFKTHVLTRVTGALKNSYGIVVGGDKARLHLDYPDYWRFSELIVMDGIVCIQGNGPQNKFLYNAGKLLASDNGVALDSVMSRMIGINPESIASIAHARDLGLGPIDESEIEVVGDAGRLKRFRRPVPSIPQRFAGTWAMAFFPDIGRPRFDVDEGLCDSCRTCQERCPAGAITVQGRDGPVFDHDGCISCYCCMELCPRTALTLHETARTRIYRRLGYM
jgi:uncharacterized protein (DUF362 family)/Pyruvate/2-oxoacid:ferredoxin oxidoreductase delta subunit